MESRAWQLHCHDLSKFYDPTDYTDIVDLAGGSARWAIHSRPSSTV